MGCNMLKTKRDILFFLAVVVLYSLAFVVIVVTASEDPPVMPGQIQGTVTYDDGCDPGYDTIWLYDSTETERLAYKLIQGSPVKHWYNMLRPPDNQPGHYYVVGIGEDCGSEGYYVYYDSLETTTQNVLFDQPNYIEK